MHVAINALVKFMLAAFVNMLDNMLDMFCETVYSYTDNCMMPLSNMWLRISKMLCDLTFLNQFVMILNAGWPKNWHHSVVRLNFAKY